MARKKRKKKRKNDPIARRIKQNKDWRQRRTNGSARGISSYEQYMIQQQNSENEKLKKKLKSAKTPAG